VSNTADSPSTRRWPRMISEAVPTTRSDGRIPRPPSPPPRRFTSPDRWAEVGLRGIGGSTSVGGVSRTLNHAVTPSST